MLNNSAISQLLESCDLSEALLIAPKPDAQTISQTGAASIDLRLGTWFITTRLSRHALMDIYSKNDDYPTEENVTTKHYVPFGKKFILHPGSFVLAATLEWIRIKAVTDVVKAKKSPERLFLKYFLRRKILF